MPQQRQKRERFLLSQRLRLVQTEAKELLTMPRKTLKRPFASPERVADEHHSAGKFASLPGPSKKSLHLP